MAQAQQAGSHAAKCWMSISKTRLSSLAQVMRAGAPCACA
jgi:hypothetical protein